MNEKENFTTVSEIPEPVRRNLNRFRYVIAGIPLFYFITIYLNGWSFETLIVCLLLGLIVFYFYLQKRKICLEGQYVVIEGLIEEIEDSYIREKLHEFIPLYKQKENGEGKRLVVLKLDGDYVRVHLGSQVRNTYRENTAVRIYAAEVRENTSGMDEIYDYLAIDEVPVEELEAKLDFETEENDSLDFPGSTIRLN